MRRRNFIAMFGSVAVVAPFPAHAQQPAPPVIGFLSTASHDVFVTRLRAFHQGLKEGGFVEGQNVKIEYRWAEGENDRLPMLAAELVDRQVAVIVAAGTPPAVAAKAATATIPIVFETATDPVKVGLVASLSRPGGNLTGVTNRNVEIGPKQLELLRELVPTVTLVGLLVNPASPSIAEPFTRTTEAAARALGMQLHVLQASTERDFDTVFATLVQLRAGGLVIMPDLFFYARSEQLAALTVRHAVPTVYRYRSFVAAGGLASYASSETESYDLMGIYAGKILKGAKPGDLPVQQATRVELIINLKTANALGLTVPPSLLARADEVIE